MCTNLADKLRLISGVTCGIVNHVGYNETLRMKNRKNTLDSSVHPSMKNSESAVKSRYIMLCEIKKNSFFQAGYF